MHHHHIKEYAGLLTASESTKIAIVASRFNHAIVEHLIEGALDILIRQGVPKENITLTWVPGAFELPLVAQRWAESGDVDAVVCLGTVIRGATPHFDYVCGQSASGLSHAALKTGIPVIFGVLTTETIEQAVERSGTKSGNKGADSATAALEMISILSQLPSKNHAKSSTMVN